MGLSHSPKIVTNDLIGYWDAGNSRSYPGSGTTWFDISGNGLTGALTNGAAYAIDSSMAFDGSDDRVLITNNNIARIGTGNHTILAWINNTVTAEEDIFGTSGTATGDVLLMIVAAAGGGAGGLRGHAWGSTGNANAIDSPRAFGTGKWAMVGQRVTWGGNIDLIENNSITNSQALVGSAPTSTQTVGSIGFRNTGGTSACFQGKIAAIQFYNRALTNAEISQNYNALRGRFGL